MEPNTATDTAATIAVFLIYLAAAGAIVTALRKGGRKPESETQTAETDASES